MCDSHHLRTAPSHRFNPQTHSPATSHISALPTPTGSGYRLSPGGDKDPGPRWPLTTSPSAWTATSPVSPPVSARTPLPHWLSFPTPHHLPCLPGASLSLPDTEPPLASPSIAVSGEDKVPPSTEPKSRNLFERNSHKEPRQGETPPREGVTFDPTGKGCAVAFEQRTILSP